jgi:hypothetical protein
MEIVSFASRGFIYAYNDQWLTVRKTNRDYCQIIIESLNEVSTVYHFPERYYPYYRHMIEDSKVVNGYVNALAHVSEELFKELGQDLISDSIGDLHNAQLSAALPEFAVLLELTDTVRDRFKKAGQLIRAYKNYSRLNDYAETYNIEQVEAINVQRWETFSREMRQLEKLYQELRDRLVQGECQKFDQEDGVYPRTTRFPGLPVNYYIRGY